MIRLRDLIREFGTRRRITKADAKRMASAEEWRAFEKKLKQKYPKARPTFWSDGGAYYAQINLDGISTVTLNITGQFNTQD